MTLAIAGAGIEEATKVPALGPKSGEGANVKTTRNSHDTNGKPGVAGLVLIGNAAWRTSPRFGQAGPHYGCNMGSHRFLCSTLSQTQTSRSATGAPEP
jgi:hypothetical protein